MPKDTFTHSATTAAPRTEVWAAREKPETWEAIGGVDRVTDSISDEEGRLQRFSFESAAGGMKYVGKATPHTREHERIMAWKVATSEMRGIATVELFDADQGTRVDATLQVESSGVLSTMFFPVIAAAIGAGFPKAVDEFAESLG